MFAPAAGVLKFLAWNQRPIPNLPLNLVMDPNDESNDGQLMALLAAGCTQLGITLQPPQQAQFEQYYRELVDLERTAQPHDHYRL